jgi:hypothetical protein
MIVLQPAPDAVKQDGWKENRKKEFFQAWRISLQAKNPHPHCDWGFWDCLIEIIV